MGMIKIANKFEENSFRCMCIYLGIEDEKGNFSFKNNVFV
jgi:hypothetical protein